MITFLAPATAYSQAKRELLRDGVEHWYVTEPGKDESYLTKKFKEIYNIAFTDKGVQPFGRSVAFLAGVSAYRDLPPLPSVRNDIIEMRDFLLKKAGFDEVYVATDDVVKRDRIEQYIKEILYTKMQRNDRLLFYYSGHGGDNNGKTGYMLFANAPRKGQFWGQEVLAIATLSDWSRELQIQHVLFILDSCASGLGIAPKSSPSESDRLLSQTLSGNGSRTVLTAGTADEATYALENRRNTGNGAFTRAFLDAFDFRSSTEPSAGFITITDLFAEVEKRMAKFRIQYGKATTPRMYTLQDQEYRGTFVFLNPKSTSARLTYEQAKALGVMPYSKRESGESRDVGSGIIEVFSTNGGQLYLDDQSLGYMVSGQTQQFLQQTPGEHQIRMQMTIPATASEVKMQDEVKKILVENGKISYATFGLKSPIDESGIVPVGTLVIQSIHELNGEAYIDSFGVGRLEKNGQLTIAHLTAGAHTYRIVGAKQTESGSVLIKPNQTEYTVLTLPSPPTNISVIVQ